MKTWRIDQLLHFYLNFWVLSVCDIHFCIYGTSQDLFLWTNPCGLFWSANTRIEIWTKVTSLNSQYIFLDSRHSEDNENAIMSYPPKWAKKPTAHGFCFLKNFKTKSLWPLFMDGVQLPQGYMATRRREFTFYCKNFWKCSFGVSV